MVRNKTPSDENYDLLDYSGHYTYSTRSTDSKQEQNLSPSLRLFGNFNIGKNQTLEFTAKGSYTQNDYTRQYTENENNSLSDGKEDLYSFNSLPIIMSNCSIRILLVLISGITIT